MSTMGSLGVIIVLACSTSAWAGWNDSKGAGNRYGQWYRGKPYYQHRYGGKGGSMHDGNSMNDSMAMLAQFLEKNSKSRKSRRDKSSSRSRSSSARDKRGKRRTRSASRELRELRRYREEAEASKKAAVEKEKQAEEKLLRERELQDLEARILKKVTYHQPAPKKPSGVSASSRGPENGERSVEYELQPLALKAIDWIMEKSIDVSEVKTWQGIEEQLSSLDNGTLKDFFAKHISESNIPRSKAQKVSQFLEFLMAEVH